MSLRGLRWPALGAEGGGGVAVQLVREHAGVAGDDDDPVGIAGGLDGDIAVEDIGKDTLRVAL